MVNRRHFLQASTVGCVSTLGAANGDTPPASLGQQQTDEGIVFHKEKNATRLMRGFPPPGDKRVSLDNYADSVDRTRWAFQNANVVFKTIEVERGNGDVAVLPRYMLDSHVVDRITVSWGISPQQSERITVADWLRRTNTDAFVVLHKGHIVVEQYFGEAKPDTRHLIWSCGKSLLATLVAGRLYDGSLDARHEVEKFVPELSKTGLKGATLQQLLDQQTGLGFREYPPLGATPEVIELFTHGTKACREADHEYATYERTAGLFAKRPHERQDTGLYDFLLTQTDQPRPHGVCLWYAEPNPVALQWILERATGRSLSQLLSEELLEPLGFEHRMNAIIDDVGTIPNGSGLSLTARDAARWCQMVLQRGEFNGRRVVPTQFIDDLMTVRHADKINAMSNLHGMTSPGAGYRNLFWSLPSKVEEKPIIAAAGLYGQTFMVDVLRDIVVVKMSTDNDFTHLTYDGIALRSLSEALSSIVH